MMRRFNLWNLAAGLFGLLLLSAAGLYLGHVDNRVDADSESYEPGGTRAFAALLERSGFQVSHLDFLPAKPIKDSLEIVFIDNWTGVQLALESDGLVRKNASWSAIGSQIEAGNSVMVFRVGSTQIQQESRETVEVKPSIGVGKTWKLSFPMEVVPATASNSVEEMMSRALDPDVVRLEPGWVAQDDFVSGLFSVRPKSADAVVEPRSKSGVGVALEAGDIALNENIDQGDNAAFLLSMVRLAAGPKIKNIVFLDGSFEGGRQAGVLDILGAWSKGAWIQLLVVTLAVIWGLGMRFGLPTLDRSQQRSTRELLDGMADTMARGRQTNWALWEIARSADQKIRARLSLPPTATKHDRDRRIPTELALALGAAEMATGSETESQAVALAARLDENLDQWLLAERAKRS